MQALPAKGTLNPRGFALKKALAPLSAVGGQIVFIPGVSRKHIIQREST